MNNSGIRRILVALDSSAVNRTALQAAAMMAARLQAELQAVFIEDINLLRLAELPFVREMTVGSREARRISLTRMEWQIQQQAEQIRSDVETLAQQQQLKVEFRVIRGHISDELCIAAQHMDLLILGKNAQSLQQSSKIGKVAQDVLAGVKCSVLVLQHGSLVERPVAILFDGSAASLLALQLAIQLAHGDHDQLCVIFPAVQPDKLDTLQQQVRTLGRDHGIEAGEQTLPANTVAALLAAVANCQGRVLMVEADSEVLDKTSLQSLIQQSHIPVIITR